VSSALNGLALSARATGEFDRARQLHEESMQLYARRGDALGVAMAGVPLFAFDRAVRQAVDVEREPVPLRNPSFEIAFEEALATFR
jgi:hypothetical protein